MEAGGNAPASAQRFHWYLAGIGVGAIAMGLQVVLFPWILVGVLHETPDRVGLAQGASAEDQDPGLEELAHGNPGSRGPGPDRLRLLRALDLRPEVPPRGTPNGLGCPGPLRAPSLA